MSLGSIDDKKLNKVWHNLENIYGTVLTLDHFLRQQAPRNAELQLVQAKDKPSYTSFLQSTLICWKSCQRLPKVTSTEQDLHQNEIVLAAVKRIQKREGKASNVLTLGFGIGSEDSGAHISTWPGLEYSFPNHNVTSLQLPTWITLLGRVGDELMLQLLEMTSIFVQVSGGCYVQLAGKPIYELWSFVPCDAITYIKKPHPPDDKIKKDNWKEDRNEEESQVMKSSTETCSIKKICNHAKEVGHNCGNSSISDDNSQTSEESKKKVSSDFQQVNPERLHANISSDHSTDGNHTTFASPLESNVAGTSQAAIHSKTSISVSSLEESVNSKHGNVSDGIIESPISSSHSNAFEVLDISEWTPNTDSLKSDLKRKRILSESSVSQSKRRRLLRSVDCRGCEEVKAPNLDIGFISNLEDEMEIDKDGNLTDRSSSSHVTHISDGCSHSGSRVHSGQEGIGSELDSNLMAGSLAGMPKEQRHPEDVSKNAEISEIPKSSERDQGNFCTATSELEKASQKPKDPVHPNAHVATTDQEDPQPSVAITSHTGAREGATDPTHHSEEEKNSRVSPVYKFHEPIKRRDMLYVKDMREGMPCNFHLTRFSKMPDGCEMLVNHIFKDDPAVGDNVALQNLIKQLLNNYRKCHFKQLLNHHCKAVLETNRISGRSTKAGQGDSNNRKCKRVRTDDMANTSVTTKKCMNEYKKDTVDITSEQEPELLGPVYTRPRVTRTVHSSNLRQHAGNPTDCATQLPYSKSQESQHTEKQVTINPSSMIPQEREPGNSPDSVAHLMKKYVEANVPHTSIESMDNPHRTFESSAPHSRIIGQCDTVLKPFASEYKDIRTIIATDEASVRSTEVAHCMNIIDHTLYDTTTKESHCSVPTAKARNRTDRSCHSLEKEHVGSAVSSPLENYVSHRQIFLYLRVVFIKVVPEELIGSRHNRNVLLKNIQKFVGIGKFERMYIGEFMNSMQSFFYATDTAVCRNRIFYFRKKVWRSLQGQAVQDLTSGAMLKPIIKKNVEELINSQKSLGICSMRFLPKASGLRPITNLANKQDQGPSINRQLLNIYHVLRYEQTCHPGLLASAKLGMDDIYDAWLEFVKQRKTMGDNRKLYFVKVDIKACYDSIVQQEMLDIIRDILKKNAISEYIVRRYASVFQANGRLNRVFHRSVAPLEEFQPDFMKFVRVLLKENKVHDAFLVDQVLHQAEDVTSLLKKLEAHLLNNIVMIGGSYYHQICGIPQGSILSSMLCAIYYASMEREHLTVKDDELLMRQVDDFLFVTPSLDNSKQFLAQMLAGFPDYNCYVNPAKTLTNYITDGHPDVGTVDDSELFPWCGMCINTQSLEVSVNYARYAGLSIHDTMTFDTGKKAGQHLKSKMLLCLRPRCHGMYLDPQINTLGQRVRNLYLLFLLSAYQFHSCVKSLPSHRNASKNYKYFHEMILDLPIYVARKASTKIKGMAHGLEVKGLLVEWLCLKAFICKLQRHHSSYKQLLKALRKRQKLLEKKMGAGEVVTASKWIQPEVPEAFDLIL